MKRKLNSRRGGFTLVEIMIVVAIIALLATIAIPNFLRARKRSQASALLEDLRIIEAAKDQYAIEYNLKGNAAITWANLKNYIKPSAAVYNRPAGTGGNPTDLFGSDITVGLVDSTPQIGQGTYDAFTDVDLTVNFWGGFYNAGS
ncbi:type IV pilin protein [Verrucomicrobiota bacterium sgz303538]